MSVAPFESLILSGLLGHEACASHFSPSSEIAAIVRFEVALARAEAAEGVIAETAGEAIEKACLAYEPDFAALRDATARDGVVVPELVRQVKANLAMEHRAAVHHGATSQDAIDTGLVLRLGAVADLVVSEIDAVIDAIDELGRRQGDRRLMGRTRMRRARPLTVADRLRTWSEPLTAERQRLAEMRPRLLVLQLGGPVGDGQPLGDTANAVAARMAEHLGLNVPVGAWHSQRGVLAEFAACLARISGALGKIGQDVVLMNQDEIGEIALSGGGGSSAMAGKENPVLAEILVTLARFTAVQSSAMHHALVHEQERSGAAWTLEWMVLPQMCVATCAALARAATLLGSVQFLGTSED